jgi:hypothetical protein
MSILCGKINNWCGEFIAYVETQLVCCQPNTCFMVGPRIYNSLYPRFLPKPHTDGHSLTIVNLQIRDLLKTDFYQHYNYLFWTGVVKCG